MFSLTAFQLPHWLMIAGTFLVVAGFIGALVAGRKAKEAVAFPDQRSDTPQEQAPPLPKLPSSKKKPSGDGGRAP
jgi:hypothetical protein